MTQRGEGVGSGSFRDDGGSVKRVAGIGSIPSVALIQFKHSSTPKAPKPPKPC